MLAVNDLFYLASPYIASFFLEDVESWLTIITTSDIHRNVKLTGQEWI